MKAVEASVKAGFFAGILQGFVTKAPSQFVQTVVRAIATQLFKRWFKHLTISPEKRQYSTVGKAGVQYSVLTAHWRDRVMVNAPESLPICIE
jgi:hypothetical protein